MSRILSFKDDDNDDKDDNGGVDDDVTDDDCHSETEKARRNLFDVAQSEEHLRNHKPCLPNHCEICRRAKAKHRRRCRKAKHRLAQKFGDVVTCDHVMMRDWMENPGVHGFCDNFNVLDLATRCKYSYPSKSLCSLECVKNLNHMKGEHKLLLG